MEETVRRIMADVLDLDPDTIDEGTAQDSTDAWDSLKHITLCLALEQEFQVALEVHEIEAMVTYADVLMILQQKL
jgi:acyl carrier protein